MIISGGGGIRLNRIGEESVGYDKVGEREGMTQLKEVREQGSRIAIEEDKEENKGEEVPVLTRLRVLMSPCTTPLE